MTSRFIVAAFIGLSLSLLAAPALSDELNINVGYQPGTSPRFFVAKNEKMFEKAGLSPNYVKFTAGPAMLAALRGKDIDVAFMTTPPVIFGLSQGLDLKVFFIESDAAETQALVAIPNGAIKSFADQQGRRIGVTFGSSAHYALLKSLQEANLNPGNVIILDMQPGTILPAFIRNDVDGAWCWDPWTAKMESENGRLIGSLGSMHLPMPGVWVARAEWLSGEEAKVQRFIKAMDLTSELLLTDQTGAIAAIGEQLGVDEPVATRIFDRIERPSLTTQIFGYGYEAALGTTRTKASSGMAAHMNDVAEFFYSRKQIPAKPDVISAIEPGPLERYLAAKK
jgi:ABC-type nitrate/sulfonate/bicarbonate transport system substrate-binding protein